MPGWLMNKMRETFFKKLQKFCSNENKTVETELPTEKPKGAQRTPQTAQRPKIQEAKIAPRKAAVGAEGRPW